MKKIIILLIVLITLSAIASAQEYNITNDGKNKYNPRWAPNSSTLVYLEDINATHRHVFLGDINGNNYDLYNDSMTYPGGASSGFIYMGGAGFNPAGTKVAASGYNASTMRAQVQILNITPASRINITGNNSIYHYFEDWSPDGNWIIYVRNRTTSSDKYLYKISATGGAEINLSNGTAGAFPVEYHSRYSPDGQWVYFEKKQNLFSIMRVNSSGGLPTTIAEDNVNYMDSEYPDVSPDGKWVSFQRVDGVNWVYQIYKANATGAGPEIQLTNCTNDCKYASWSPDGTQLVFQMYDGSNEQIATISATAANATPTALTSDGEDHQEPYWSPDGTKIAFVRGYTEIGVYEFGPTSCTSFTQRNDTNITPVSGSWPFGEVPENGSQTQATPPSKVSFPLNTGDITWASGCSPTSEDGSYIGSSFSKYTYALFAADYYFVKEASYPEGMVYLYASSSSPPPLAFRVIKVDSDGMVTAAKNYNSSSSIDVKSITVNPDGTQIFVSGYIIADNASLAKLDANLNVVWSYTYDFNNSNLFNDVKYDENGFVVVAGRADDGAGTDWHILTTVNSSNGNLIDYEKLTSNNADAKYDQQIALKQNTGSDTDVYFAGEDNSNNCGDTDILYGKFAINKSTGNIGTANYLRFIGCDTGIDAINLEYLTLSTQNKMDMTVTTEYHADPWQYYGGIVRIATNGSVEVARGFGLDEYTSKQTEMSGGAAMFAVGTNIARLNSNTSLNLWNFTGSTNIAPTRIAYGLNKYFVSFTTAANTFGVAKIDSGMTTVEYATELTQSTPITDTVQSLFYHPDLLWLFVASNDGGGFQNFGNGEIYSATNPNGTMQFTIDRVVAIQTMSPDINILNFQLRWQNFSGTFDTTKGTCIGCTFDAMGTCQAEVEKIWGMYNSYNITINLTPDKNMNLQELQMCCRDLNRTIALGPTGTGNCTSLTTYPPSTYSTTGCFTPTTTTGYSYNTSDTVCIYLQNITTSGIQIPLGTITPTPTCEQIACEINGTWNASNDQTFTINKTITVTAI